MLRYGHHLVLYLFLIRKDNMTQEQLIKIIEEQKDLKNLPNSNLIQMMDFLWSHQ
mgnify:CR=1 FL=1